MKTPTPQNAEVSAPSSAHSTEPSLQWTVFFDVRAQDKQDYSGTCGQLADQLRNAGTYTSKADCPLLKLATFGDQRTSSGSLRHNANVLALSGIEVDYDAEVMSMQDAADLLRSMGIMTVLYPSPSSTTQAPRWRVLCPLSTSTPPSEHGRLVARLNGALGGVLAPESFALSQSYYFGATPTNDFQVIEVYGEYIDKLSVLDMFATGKNGGAVQTSQPAISSTARPEITLEIAREMLVSIKPDCNRENWRNVGMGLAHQFGDDGFDLWDEWSSASIEGKYKEREMQGQWDSFKTDHPNGVTIGTVMRMARQGGWAGITHDLTDLFPAISTQTAGTHPLAVFVPVSYQPRHPEFLIPGAIGMGLVVYSGEAGIGKTSTLLPLACMVAGVHEAGHPLAPRHWRHVVYIVEDVEQSQRILAGMATMSWFNGDAARERVHIVDAVRLAPAEVAKVGRIYADNFTRIVDGVVLLPLVVIDTKAAVLDIEDENSNSETSRAIAALKQGFEKLPIWLIGHTAKASQGVTDAASLSSRGAGSSGADANQTLFLVNDNGTRYLKRGKTRFEASWDALEITTNTTNLIAPDQWGDLAPLTLRWNSIKPPTVKPAISKAVREQQAADADREKLHAQIIEGVTDGFETGNPLNRAAIKLAINRKSSDVVSAIEGLLCSHHLFEVEVPKDERVHPKKASYLISLTETERSNFRDTGELPASKMVIPPSWTVVR